MTRKKTIIINSAYANVIRAQINIIELIKLKSLQPSLEASTGIELYIHLNVSRCKKGNKASKISKLTRKSGTGRR